MLEAFSLHITINVFVMPVFTLSLAFVTFCVENEIEAFFLKVNKSVLSLWVLKDFEMLAIPQPFRLRAIGLWLR